MVDVVGHAKEGARDDACEAVARPLAWAPLRGDEPDVRGTGHREPGGAAHSLVDRQRALEVVVRVVTDVRQRLSLGRVVDVDEARDVARRGRLDRGCAPLDDQSAVLAGVPLLVADPWGDADVARLDGDVVTDEVLAVCEASREADDLQVAYLVADTSVVEGRECESRVG